MIEPAVPCRRCNNRMDLVATIRPIGNAPGLNAYACTIDVPSLDDSLQQLAAAGGTLALPKMAIPGVGWLAYAKDTEGNIFGMMQMDPKAK